VISMLKLSVYSLEDDNMIEYEEIVGKRLTACKVIMPDHYARPHTAFFFYLKCFATILPALLCDVTPSSFLFPLNYSCLSRQRHHTPLNFPTICSVSVTP
jgi:hypothetical protein